MFFQRKAPKSARNTRRDRRIGFQLPARCRRGPVRTTIMLRDMTTHGARIEGLLGLRIDEALTLYLPGLRPKEAYVAWTSGHSAGLEFDRPLHPEVYFQLVANFAIGTSQSDFALMPA